MASPAEKQQRRMTLPAPPSSNTMANRPPSPLRTSYLPNTFTGITHDDNDQSEDGSDQEDDDDWAKRSTTSSVSQFAVNFAQRVMGAVSGPPAMLTDAELEAQAETERDRSRREAERILTREAEERRRIEEGVLRIKNNTPPRSHTLPSPVQQTTPNSNSTPTWWTTAKNRLTPTKEPLTPAQQVIHDAKQREKGSSDKKSRNSREWPADASKKYSDPALLNLNFPRPGSAPSSPTPGPVATHSAPNLTPSPMRSLASSSGMSAALSPSKEAPPLYAQFSSSGTLDVPSTLLTIARRFEKLEKWTVGHVRALEERMGDVERWLVEKEAKAANANDLDIDGKAHNTSNSNPLVAKQIRDLREDLSEMQGRLGDLGREMAQVVIGSSGLNGKVEAKQGQVVSATPEAVKSSFVVHDQEPEPDEPGLTSSVQTIKHSQSGSQAAAVEEVYAPRLSSSSVLESTSPPLRSNARSVSQRLPYPTGDYASPTNSAYVSPARAASPRTTSPSPFTSISGLPMPNSGGGGLGLSFMNTGSNSNLSSSSPGLPSMASSSFLSSPTTLLSTPTPASSTARPSSVSPTLGGRKRYTVALGGSIADPNPEPISSTPPLFSGSGRSTRQRPQSAVGLGSEFFSGLSSDDDGDENITAEPDTDEDLGNGDETIGKRSSKKFVNSTDAGSTPMKDRSRAQSAYGYGAILKQSQAAAAPSTTATKPLRLRSQSQSADRSPSANGIPARDPNSKFVDPLVLRRQSQQSMNSIASPKPLAAGKVPIGQLVKFFDGDK